MALWQDIRRKAGAGVAQLGSWLNLPEMGISEGIVGRAQAATPYQNQPTGGGGGGAWGPQQVAGVDTYQPNYQPSYGPQTDNYAPSPNLGAAPTGPSAAETAAWNAQYEQVMGDYDQQLRAIEAQKLGLMSQAKQFRQGYQRELGKLGTQHETVKGGQSAYFTNTYEFSKSY